MAESEFKMKNCTAITRNSDPVKSEPLLLYNSGLLLLLPLLLLVYTWSYLVNRVSVVDDDDDKEL